MRIGKNHVRIKGTPCCRRRAKIHFEQTRLVTVRDSGVTFLAFNCPRCRHRGRLMLEEDQAVEARLSCIPKLWIQSTLGEDAPSLLSELETTDFLADLAERTYDPAPLAEEKGGTPVTIIKASCPICGAVELTSSDVRLMVCNIPTRSYYAFECPTCRDEVRKPADEHVISLLISEGVPPTAFEVPEEAMEVAEGPRISYDELLEFVLRLEVEDDIAALAAADSAR